MSASRVSLLFGSLVGLLGAIVLAGWMLDAAALKALVPGLATMKANTALGFLGAGAALALLGAGRAERLGRICAALVLLLGALTFIEHVARIDLRVDELLFADSATPPAFSPGRMSLATSLGLLLAGAGLLLLPGTVRSPVRAATASGIGLGVVLLGAIALAGYATRLDVLYAWPAFGTVAAHTAGGFAVLGIGIVLAGRARLPSLSEDLQIAGLAASLLALAAAATGLAAYATLESAVERNLAEGVTLALEARISEMRSTIELRTARAEIITTRPNMLRFARLHANEPGNAEFRAVVQGVLASFRSHGFSAVTVADQWGEEYARVGEFMPSAAVEVALADGAGTLLWNRGLHLRSQFLLRDAAGALGVVLAEQRLQNVEAALSSVAALGESAELLVCAPGAGVFACFLTRLSRGEPVTIPVGGAAGERRLARRAAEEGAGFGTALDYRGRRVLGAFAPVGATGLVAVLKMDADEIYAPLATRFQLALVLIAGFAIGGALLVYARVKPLAGALEHKVRERTAQLEAARDSLARQADRLHLLHEIDRAIIVEAKPEAIAGAVLQPLRRLLGVPRVNVNLVDRAAGEGEWLAAAGRRRMHLTRGVRFPLHMLGDLDALGRGEPQMVETSALPASPQRDALLASGVRHYMVAPMLAGGELIGALSFGGAQSSFPEEQTAIACEATAQLAIAITHARLLERTTRDAERLRIVHEIDRAIIAEIKPAAMAAAVLQPLRELLGVPRVVINLFDLRAGEVEWLAAAGRRQVHGGGVRYSLRFMGDVEALKRGEAQTIESAALPDGAERDALLASGVRHYMVVPMIAGGELIGALSFGGESAVFASDQATIAREAADQLAIAITQAGLFERVERHAAELEQKVRERTEELRATNRELEAFSYSVSHDLRSPLRAIDGYALMLEEDYAAKLDDEGRRLLGVVRQEAMRMAALIEDLLRFARIGRAPLAAVPLDVASQVRGVVLDLASAHPKTRIELGPLPAATGDSSLLRQVWVNLIGNAIKYSGKRGDARVEIGGSMRDEESVYWVRDNGAGFDMRYQEKLFKVFQRLHRPEEFEGTGIGLAIVQRIVTRHGGKVWAEGEPDKGACFYFSLPVVARADTQEAS